MIGTPVVRVDPNLPTCPACAQNVDLDGGYIKPHALKFSALGVEKIVKDKKGVMRARREYYAATAFCRKSNRPMPGEVLTKKDRDSRDFRETVVNADDAIASFLISHPNRGFTALEIANVCELYDRKTWKLDKGLVDVILTGLQKLLKAGIVEWDDKQLIHTEVDNREVWAVVT